MPDFVLQMALLGQPIAKGKTGIFPSEPWVAINEPQLYLPPCLMSLSSAYWEKAASEIRAGKDMCCAALAEGCS